MIFVQLLFGVLVLKVRNLPHETPLMSGIFCDDKFNIRMSLFKHFYFHFFLLFFTSLFYLMAFVDFFTLESIESGRAIFIDEDSEEDEIAVFFLKFSFFHLYYIVLLRMKLNTKIFFLLG
jgi:hypothetical protein